MEPFTVTLSRGRHASLFQSTLIKLPTSEVEHHIAYWCFRACRHIYVAKICCIHLVLLPSTFDGPTKMKSIARVLYNLEFLIEAEDLEIT